MVRPKELWVPTHPDSSTVSGQLWALHVSNISTWWIKD
jgi:hypothetical protein